jgi:hypothetical protein
LIRFGADENANEKRLAICLALEKAKYTLNIEYYEIVKLSLNDVLFNELKN